MKVKDGMKRKALLGWETGLPEGHAVVDGWQT